ncbi:stearoyl-CoA desaturase (delta-9 desaturase) [Herbihabitans rhizosphaerae]|uniref:Stearoyl-CoA desaturase (Delta-9 desaturase) n=1 Tax=Herbihabitans rhizosphaerae TaxID=1872711 RepID=A0A4V2ERG8_9PSEU|nr:acyl-CoA desaturase [Herbihabitans rhizosphaerae]RZS31263.1 stearoyl-CoA desaturase (delta-9 desaturase) [Herbihabitans rhizosphaerae]
MTATAEGQRATTTNGGAKPIFGERRGFWPQFGTYIFILGPFVAVIAAVPFAWGWGLGWVDIGLAAFFYTLTILGVTVGFHRYFTHGAFKAKRGMRIALAIAGSMALQGPILHWVADHRRHHAFSDREGDPHSPWLFGTSPIALMRGFWHAHMGWIFDRKLTNAERFAPDMLADKDMVRVHKQFGMWTAVTLVAPAVLGGLLTWSWWGAVTAFFWAGLVRVGFAHHVTWSTNSVCHMIGERPFKSRDKAANFWPLAILSMGEAWHNLHHADPTSARHGVLRGQIDISARLIWVFEKFGWVYQVRWPTPERLARVTAD